MYQLRELDDAGRIEALRLRAAQRGLQLPAETAEYLLRRMPRDLASLFGAARSISTRLRWSRSAA